MYVSCSAYSASTASCGSSGATNVNAAPTLSSKPPTNLCAYGSSLNGSVIESDNGWYWYCNVPGGKATGVKCYAKGAKTFDCGTTDYSCINGTVVDGSESYDSSGNAEWTCKASTGTATKLCTGTKVCKCQTVISADSLTECLNNVKKKASLTPDPQKYKNAVTGAQDVSIYPIGDTGYYIFEAGLKQDSKKATGSCVAGTFTLPDTLATSTGASGLAGLVCKEASGTLAGTGMLSCSQSTYANVASGGGPSVGIASTSTAYALGITSDQTKGVIYIFGGPKVTTTGNNKKGMSTTDGSCWFQDFAQKVCDKYMKED